MEQDHLDRLIMLLKEKGLTKEQAFQICFLARTENRAKELILQIQNGLEQKDYWKAAKQIAKTID